MGKPGIGDGGSPSPMGWLLLVSTSSYFLGHPFQNPECFLASWTFQLFVMQSPPNQNLRETTKFLFYFLAMHVYQGFSEFPGFPEERAVLAPCTPELSLLIPSVSDILLVSRPLISLFTRASTHTLCFFPLLPRPGLPHLLPFPLLLCM